jgi:hypothetical protein
MTSFQNKDPVEKVLLLKGIIEESMNRIYNLSCEENISKEKILSILAYLETSGFIPNYKKQFY